MALLTAIQIAVSLGVWHAIFAASRSTLSGELLDLGTRIAALGQRLSLPGELQPLPLPPVPPPEAGWVAPPGLELAFDLGREQITMQLESIDGLDVKAGVVVTALSVAAGAFLVSTNIPLLSRIVITLILVLASVDATRAFLVRYYQDAPNIDRVTSAADYDPVYIKEVFLPNILSALEHNRRVAWKKSVHLNRAVVIASVGIILLAVGKLAGIQ